MSDLVDVNSLEELKPGRDPTRRLMNKEQVRQYQAGEYEAEPPPSGIRLAEPERPPEAPPQAQPAQPPQAPAQPQQVPSAPALVSNAPPAEGAPVQPQDTERVKTRINRLYAQWKGAEEKNDAYENRIAQLESQLQRMQPPAQPAQQPPPQGYNEFDLGPSPQPQSPPAGYVSRDELKGLFGQFAQELSRQQQLADARRAAQAEAEQEFAQEFRDPEFQATYHEILTRDAALQADPAGPLKAATLARGILADRLYSGAGTASPDARKQAISGLGPSIAEGAQGAVPDQVAQYQQALARAKQTGDTMDFAHALALSRRLGQ